MTDSEKIKRAADLINEAERWLMATAGFQPITEALAAIKTARHEVVKLKAEVEAQEDAEAELPDMPEPTREESAAYSRSVWGKSEQPNAHVAEPIADALAPFFPKTDKDFTL